MGEGGVGLFVRKLYCNVVDCNRAGWDVDCEQSLFIFRFSEGSAREGERRAAKPLEARNEGDK